MLLFTANNETVDRFLILKKRGLAQVHDDDTKDLYFHLSQKVTTEDNKYN